MGGECGKNEAGREAVKGTRRRDCGRRTGEVESAEGRNGGGGGDGGKDGYLKQGCRTRGGDG